MSTSSPGPSTGRPAGGPARSLPVGTRALDPFERAGILGDDAIQVAAYLERTAPGTPTNVLLAAALCVRGLAHGHICVEIASVPRTTADDRETANAAPPDWPDPKVWAEDLQDSDLVAVVDPTDALISDSTLDTGIAPLVFDGTRVYLERYWRYERQVGDSLLAGTGSSDPPSASAAGNRRVPEELLDRYLGPVTDEQGNANLARRAGSLINDRRVTVLAGGPGTGKTHTIARLLAASLHASGNIDRPLQVALAAPTGKAAARMAEAIGHAVEQLDLPDDVAEQLRNVETSTIHRLLGYRDGITFRADHNHPLSHDLVVIDETSMVALPLMARLLDALRADTRLILVGDPFQLESVEAGSVLADLVGPAARNETPPTGALSDGIVVLRRVHRFTEGSAIAALADAIRSDDATRTMEILTDADHKEALWVDPHDDAAIEALRRSVAGRAAESVDLAATGTPSAALEVSNELKVLCGTRFGELGSRSWQDQIERRLSGWHERAVSDQWYVGRPVMITRNDPITRVFNGDTGVVVVHEGRRMVALPDGEPVRYLPTSRLTDVSTWWAMTIHKSQGSEFDHAVVSLPEPGSPILTNELLYTAVTRARSQVTVVATRETIEAAVNRRVTRGSGLGSRLWP